MIKSKSKISINILSALIILISLFIGVVGQTNAWFSSKQPNGIEIIISVGDIRLKLYQIDGSDKNEIYTNTENASDSVTEKKYIKLSGPLVPVDKNALVLQLENKEAGSTDMYVRFKFELYARVATAGNVTTDQPITTTAVGNAWETGTQGFKYNSDGYYYYKSSDGTTNAKLPFNESVVLMEGFTIDASQMYDTSGSLKFATSNSLYIKLTIDASLADFTSAG